MMLRRYGHTIERLGKRYRLDDLLGSGGMADVCLAWDEQEQRHVAIKVVNADELEMKMLSRFMAEAVRTIWLNHPNIISIYGFNVDTLDGDPHLVVPYIVMEYAQGGDLSTRLKRLRPGMFYPFDEALHVFYQLCAAVDYAHRQGIIHRDLKPHNTLFRLLPDGSEQVILSDFGIAVEAEASHRSLTRSGTLAYMAPEQFRGEPVFASDIFTLGIILYQLVTNRLPFERSWQDFARTEPQTLPPLPSMLNPNVPPALDAVILQAIADDPAARFASAALFAEAARDALPAPIIGTDLTHPMITDVLPPGMPTRILPPPTDILPRPMLHITDSSPMRSVFPEPSTEHAQPLQSVSHPRLTDVTGTGYSPLSPLTGSIADSPEPITLIKRAKPTTGFPAPFPMPVAPAMPLPKPKPTKHARPASNPARKLARLTPRTLSAGLLLLLLAVMVICGGLAFAQPKTLQSLGLTKALPNITFPFSGNAVTIVPDSQTISSNYVVTGIPGTANSAQSQISIQQLSYTTPAQTAKVTGTGVTEFAAKEASGTLEFENGSFTSSYTFGTNTPFTANNGIAFYLDAPVTIAPANPNSSVLSKATGTAHAGTAGTAGNIAAGSIGITNNSAGTFVTNPTPFAGGVDAQHYTFIQQSDVNGAVNGIQGAVSASAEKGLSAQVPGGDALVNKVQCGNAQVTVDVPVGDKGPTGSATSGTASVTETCTAEAYKQADLSALATSLLGQTAQKQLGTGYAQVGSVITTVTTESASPVSLLVTAKAVFAYQFSEAQKAALATLIKGMSAQQAIATLEKQTGVKSASVPSGVSTLPSQADQITINVLTPTGLSGGGSPSPGPTIIGPGAGTPTPFQGKG